MITQASFWFFFGGLWLAVGSLFAAVGGGVLWHETALEARLAREGVAASGVVLSKSISGSSQDPSFAIEYRFKAGNAVSEGAAKVNGALWDRLVEGEAVELRYVPADPQAHRIAGQAGGQRVLGAVSAAVGGLFALSGALILWRAAARRRFVADLLREGAHAADAAGGSAPLAAGRARRGALRDRAPAPQRVARPRVSRQRLRLLAGALRDIRAPAGVLFLAAGIALAWTSAQTALDYRRAVELRGIVTAKELVRADRKENRSTRFVARYRLELPGGETVNAAVDLPRAEWEARSVGGAHPVLYVPDERRTLPPAGAANYAGGAIVGLLGVAFAVIGGLLLRKPLRVLAARMRLAQRGVQASGTVSEVFQTSTAVNGVILWQLRYRYRDASGAEHAGESDLLRPSEAARWDAGTSGAVLYDPRAPQHSAWLGGAPDAQPKKSWPALRLLRNLALFFAALLVAGVVGELFPALKALEAWMEAQRAPLLYATLGAAVLGVFLLAGAAIALVMEGGEPMSHRDIEQQQRSMRDAQALPYARRMSSYRLLGIGAGAAGHEEFALRDLKRAFASGAVLTDPVWRRRAFALLGAALMVAGLFGVFIVISPPALKLLLAAVVLYALVRSVVALALA